jgi:hypothetical protein
MNAPLHHNSLTTATAAVDPRPDSGQMAYETGYQYGRNRYWTRQSQPCPYPLFSRERAKWKKGFADARFDMSCDGL